MIYSSLMFIITTGAIIIKICYLASELVCRLILMFELAGFKSTFLRRGDYGPPRQKAEQYLRAGQRVSNSPHIYDKIVLLFNSCVTFRCFDPRCILGDQSLLRGVSFTTTRSGMLRLASRTLMYPGCSWSRVVTPHIFMVVSSSSRSTTNRQLPPFRSYYL